MAGAFTITPTSVELTNNYSIRLDYDANGNLIYLGKALLGSADSDAKWQIQKFVYDVNNQLIQIRWAKGTITFDNVWNDRTILSYT